MDLESAENSEIEALSEALERLKIPTFNIKMEKKSNGRYYYNYSRFS